MTIDPDRLREALDSRQWEEHDGNEFPFDEEIRLRRLEEDRADRWREEQGEREAEG